MDRVERVRAPDDPLPACDERIAVLHRGWRSIAPLRRIAYAALIALGVASPVEAGPIYYAFDFSGDGVVGSGTLITSGSTDPSAPFAGADDILSVSGTVNGEAITGLLGTIGPAAYSPDGYFIYDNDFYAAGSASAVGGYFDDDGLLFTTSAGTYNLFLMAARIGTGPTRARASPSPSRPSIRRHRFKSPRAPWCSPPRWWGCCSYPDVGRAGAADATLPRHPRPPPARRSLGSAHR